MLPVLVIVPAMVVVLASLPTEGAAVDEVKVRVAVPATRISPVPDGGEGAAGDRCPVTELDLRAVKKRERRRPCCRRRPPPKPFRSRMPPLVASNVP